MGGYSKFFTDPQLRPAGQAPLKQLAQLELSSRMVEALAGLAARLGYA
jgi:hypothetical protein